MGRPQLYTHGVHMRQRGGPHAAGLVACGLTICPAWGGGGAGGLSLPHLHFYGQAASYPIPCLVENMVGWTKQETVELPCAGGGQLLGNHQAVRSLSLGATH